jgi:hypothetical protein
MRNAERTRPDSGDICTHAARHVKNRSRSFLYLALSLAPNHLLNLNPNLNLNRARSLMCEAVAHFARAPLVRKFREGFTQPRIVRGQSERKLIPSARLVAAAECKACLRDCL